jgi:acyl phosphate:glycerol-3-phosphate acyltransferase
VTSLVAAALIGYLLGSIPSGLLIGRWLGGLDIRQYGSGRTGATNAMRSLGARGFALTFAADAGKAILAVLIARTLVGAALDPLVAAVAAVAAVVGHNWSIYIRFGGGRGVATSFGGMLMLYWPGALVGLAAAAILIGATRYVSLGSLGGTIVGLVVVIGAVLTGAQPPALAGFALAVAALVIWQHRDNIQRLMAGTERRIGQSTERYRPS